MLGRRSSFDPDAVAVARRRLAALAAQFEASDGVVGESSGSVPDGSATDPADRHDQHGRHRGITPAAAAGADAGLADGADGSGGDPPLAHHHVGRWQLSPHHLTVTALVTVVAMALTAWWVLRSAPDPQPVEVRAERSLPSQPVRPGSPVSPGASPGVSHEGSSGVPTAPVIGGTPVPSIELQPLIVDVAGKVRRPGIVELPAGSRVVDALEAAGGVRPDVDTAALNLARPLVDGEQIVVGLSVPAVASASPSAMPPPGGPVPALPTPSGAIARVNLNTATQVELETLPGIGPVTAQAILTWRTENGGFTSVDELLEVSGIGEATLAELTPHVHV